ncbi:MAG: hypothetical protein AB8B74_05220 [Crocinitomicaceae bacterium]
MICDYSQRLSEDIFKIEKLVGQPFSLTERIKMGGNGSPRFTIEKTSEQIGEKLTTFDNIVFGSIELRPNGIIIHFKNNLVHYIWTIPYYKLTLYSTNFESFHADGEFISFNKTQLEQKHRTFLGRLQNYRLKYLEMHFSAGPNPI